MQYHNYIFFKVRPSFYDLSSTTQQNCKRLFLKAFKNEKKVITYTYTTLGLKVNTQFLLWFQANSIDEIQIFLNTLMHTKLGRYFRITHTLFGMTRPTEYSSGSGHLDTGRKGGAYLTIYPFTKTYEWYTLSLEKRKELMKGHISIGRNYPQITQLLLYAYGVDDSEFIVSYEMDDLPAFQSLVIDLRSDKVRAYTAKDTPIFTCVYKTAEELLEFI
jgi:chlorite dismutase